MTEYGSSYTTKGVSISVEPEFVPQKSNPMDHEWLFVYHVEIKNEGEESVQLLARHWVITDGDGNEQHVRGEGVVGETPVLQKGQLFTYTSFCPLHTPMGSMRGSYLFRSETGEEFDAVVAPFLLVEPGTLN